MQDRGPAAYVAEFIGTFALVLLRHAGRVALRHGSQPARRRASQPFIDWSVIGLVHVFVLFMLIQTLAIVSGAHFNPAVTVAMVALRQIKPPDAAIYIVAQLAGAVAGALLTKLLLNEFDNADAVNFGATLDQRGQAQRRERCLGLLCRGHRHLLPGLGDRRRGGQPARLAGVGGARDRRHARPRRDGDRAR